MHFGRAPAEVYEYLGMEERTGTVQFDLEWMHQLVLMAKNVYVWFINSPEISPFHLPARSNS